MATSQLDFENEMTLYLVQCFLGSIAPEFRAIAFDADAKERTVDLFIALATPVDGIDDIVYDVELSLAGLTEGSVLLRSHVWVGADWRNDWPGRDHRRRIFASSLDS